METLSFKQKFKKRCFLFSIALFTVNEKLKNNRTAWILLDQLIRSGTSIGANVVEGGNSTSKKEFINYFNIALKSAVETLYWLALLKEIQKEHIEEIEKLITECQEIKKLISTIILNTKNNSKF
ncbi:four helix bundle protein [Candidatus Microgenomates bacterium]|nr:MAG: four helix bundle protein [Candidatus Microgenomates bacterium]